MFACLFRPPPCEPPVSLVALAEEFSPRYERHGDDLVSIDVSGLDRLIGPARAVGDALRREAAARGAARVHVALSGTRTSAHVLALARPGLTVVEPGGEAAALAPLPLNVIEQAHGSGLIAQGSKPASPAPSPRPLASSPQPLVSVLKQWGIRTLGELAALPPADLASRLGPPTRVWQAIARGDEVCPLVPTRPEERFDASLELEWPIDGLEPLSFVLTRLLEPLSTRLERRDRGVAILHVKLRLVTRDVYARRLELPAPMRDVRTLRTLAMLDLDAHPPPAAIDRVTIVIDPTPGRVLQHTLFARAHPTPEQLSTLLARLGALMGQDRIGRPVTVDSDRPGVFAMAAFATEHDQSSVVSRQSPVSNLQSPGSSPQSLASALRRCRQPVPARVATDSACRPVRVTTDRHGFVGGSVLHCAGPWRTSGEWWSTRSACGHAEARTEDPSRGISVSSRRGWGPAASERKSSPAASEESWDRDEWDVALTDGAIYRIFHDRETDGWFIDAVVD